MLICLLMAIYINQTFMRDYLVDNFRTELEIQTKVISEDAIPTFYPFEYANWLQQWTSSHSSDWVAISSRGKVLYSKGSQISEEKSAELLALVESENVEKHFGLTSGVSFAKVGKGDRGGKGIFVLYRIRENLMPVVFWLFLGVTFISIIVSSVVVLLPVTRRLRAALHSLREQTNAIARGDFGQTISAEYQNEMGELGELARDFNTMSLRLADAEKHNSELLSHVSHDLRSPLGRINIEAELLTLTSKEEKERSRGRSILDEVELLNSLVEDFLDSSRLIQKDLKLDKQLTDMGQWFDGFMERYHLRFEKKAVRVSLDIEALEFSVDQRRLQQIVGNLVDNAINAMGESGELLLRCYVNEDMASIMVKDSGKGMSPEQLERIFERFYRADSFRDPGQAGLGLGLHIVKTLVQAHQGKVEVSSVEGEGAEFIVSFPLVSPGAESDHAVEA